MAPKEKDSQMVHVRLSNYMYNGLEVVSAKLGMTISDVIRMGINNVIKKELTQRERGDLTDNETTNFLLMEYKKSNRDKDDDSYKDSEDKKHDLLQQARALEAFNYNGGGDEESHNKYFRIKQRLARECGYIYEWDKITGVKTNYCGLTGRTHEKEINYLKKTR